MNMRTKRTPANPTPARHGELAAALVALSRLGTQVVERCPAPSCPVCRSVATIAA
jgi:hypothetical protein